MFIIAESKDNDYKIETVKMQFRDKQIISDGRYYRIQYKMSMKYRYSNAILSTY